MSGSVPPSPGEAGRPGAVTRGADVARLPWAEVRVLSPAQRRAAAECVARGFAQEPAKVALVPDAATRRVVLEMSAANQLHAALRYGTAHAAVVDAELAGIAVWCPPGVPKINLTGAARGVLALVAGMPSVAGAFPHIVSVLMSDVPGVIALLRKRRRAVARASRGRTWNLLLFATVPEHRGKGLGRLLLDRQLRRCDEDGAAAWLETTDPVNPPIYQRFGFATVAHIDDVSWLPGLWVMRREPRHTTRAAAT